MQLIFKISLFISMWILLIRLNFWLSNGLVWKTIKSAKHKLTSTSLGQVTPDVVSQGDTPSLGQQLHVWYTKLLN